MNGRISIACAQAVVGSLIACGIWLGLPARWLPVDLVGTLIALAAWSCVPAVLVRSAPAAALRWVRAVIWAELAAGSLAVSLLAASMAQLAGSYGPVGSGGALLMGTIAALVVPYLVALPVLQLRWLRGAEP